MESEWKRGGELDTPCLALSAETTSASTAGKASSKPPTFQCLSFPYSEFQSSRVHFPKQQPPPHVKKKNRKSNPNHSPCPSTFTHVHVQETAGWELSAANYVFDSCSRAETTQRSSRSNTKQARQRSHCVQSWRLSKSRASMLPPDWTGF